MENCANTSNSKVSYDPGWNDPPSFAYNANQQVTTNRPRNFLNKRIAFPLSGNSNNPVPPQPVNLPPLPITLTSPVKSSLEESSKLDVQIDSDAILQEVKQILVELLECSSELGSKADSIKKKIVIMEDMWVNRKLSAQIQLQMKDLAYALRDEDPGKADDIHKALMIDHVSAVSSWMPGVKQLIYHCLARTELLAIDKEEM